MGQKVNPVVFRLGQTEEWKSRWYSLRNYKDFLKQDVLLRDFLARKLTRAGVDRIEIERFANSVKVFIKTSRPGLLIGRGGGGVEQLKSEIERFFEKNSAVGLPKMEVRLEIEEVRSPESHASIMAQEIAEQIERRVPYRRLLKQFLAKVMQAKEVEGAKITIKGRLDGAEIARTEWLAKGKIPLHTLRAKIDYAAFTAHTTYGTIGIKVWVYKGEKL